ncbi:hypothetical protein TWF788_001136 [Orbilia oligospora]|uniref:Uncharacterized protein n=1 Tax=Orbilia oligospora TaxID=2813651 RepID=A0A7C8K5P9_ORBOL|nr:hypothetical protein TWF788_001136 [Orbilia oligospora]
MQCWSAYYHYPAAAIAPEINVPTIGTTEDTLRFLVQHVLELKKNVAGMDQSLAIMAVELHFVSGAVTAVCASGLGLLMWYIKDTIKASRKTDV